MKVIGICGYARSGKDTLFDSIKRNTKQKVVRLSFGDPIKSELEDFIWEHYGISSFTEQTHEKDIIRPIVLAHGGAKRKVDPNYWLDKVEKLIDPTSDNIYVFTDIRYPIEMDLVKRLGGIGVNINKIFNPPANEDEEMLIPKLALECPVRIHIEDVYHNNGINPDLVLKKKMDREFYDHIHPLLEEGTNKFGQYGQQN